MTQKRSPRKAAAAVAAKPALTFQPATRERWDDIERLFGPRGACGGCWCMWWRLPRSEFDKQKGEGNRQAFRVLVASGAGPGVLAYAGAEPVGWCALEPRTQYPVLDRSRVLKRVDAQPVWSITCLFVAKQFRKQGVSVQLIKAAVDHAAKQGATIVEAYPVEPRKPDMPALFAFTGLVSAFRQAGFKEVARRSETRPIMRRHVKKH